MPTYDPPKYTALLLAANSMWTDEQISKYDKFYHNKITFASNSHF